MIDLFVSKVSNLHKFQWSVCQPQFLSQLPSCLLGDNDACFVVFSLSLSAFKAHLLSTNKFIPIPLQIHKIHNLRVILFVLVGPRGRVTGK